MGLPARNFHNMDQAVEAITSTVASFPSPAVDAVKNDILAGKYLNKSSSSASATSTVLTISKWEDIHRKATRDTTSPHYVGVDGLKQIYRDLVSGPTGNFPSVNSALDSIMKELKDSSNPKVKTVERNILSGAYKKKP